MYPTPCTFSPQSLGAPSRHEDCGYSTQRLAVSICSDNSVLPRPVSHGSSSFHVFSNIFIYPKASLCATFCLPISGSFRTVVQPLGNLPLFTTIPVSHRSSLNLWRVSILFLDHSESRCLQVHQLFSTGDLPLVFFLLRRPTTRYSSHSSASPISTSLSMTLFTFSSSTSSLKSRHTMFLPQSCVTFS